jgi:ribonuclease P protein subunit RPR2
MQESCWLYIQTLFIVWWFLWCMRRESNKQIALERIKLLFSQAEKAKTYKLADRYVYLARKIAMRYNLSLPKTLRRCFCHYCYIYFKPKRVKVRTNPRTKAVEYNCLSCKEVTRYGYRSENK